MPSMPVDWVLIQLAGKGTDLETRERCWSIHTSSSVRLSDCLHCQM